MKIPATETTSPRYVALDEWDTLSAIESLWEAQLAAVACLRPALPGLARAAEEAAQRLGGSETGRLVYCGAGTSGRIGVQDGAELPPTFDWPASRLVLLIAGGPAALTRAIENAEDDAQAGRQAIHDAQIGPADVVIGLAASGSTAYTLACLEEAKDRGALTIGIANSPDGALLRTVAHPILAQTGAEAVAGSTRLKAGTAQKAALNLLSTAIMLRLHRVYRGRMVDMQARNAKLRRRGIRMLRELTDIGEDTASTLLEAAGGKVKLAVLMASGEMGAEAARDLLGKHGGNLRAALGATAAENHLGGALCMNRQD